MRGVAILSIVCSALAPAASASSDPLPVDPFAGAAWSAFPSAAAPLRDHEATGGASDPTHGPAHGVNPAAVDLASGAHALDGVLVNPGPEATIEWSIDDPRHLHLRMRLADTPVKPGEDRARYHAYHWDFLVDADADGMAEFVIDVFGGDRAAAGSSPRYEAGSIAVHNVHACEDLPTGDVIADHTLGPDQIVWSARADDGEDRHTRVEPAGEQAWLAVALPWSAFTYARGACAGEQALSPGVPFGLFASTSASNVDPLQKDWLAGAPLAPSPTLQKSADRAELGPGETVAFTLTVRNDGSGVARDLVLRDPLPAHLQFVSADAGGSFDAAERVVSWTLGSLPPGASASVGFVAILDEAVPLAVAGVENVAFVGATASNAVLLPIVRRPDLALSLAATPSATGPGGTVSFRVDVANAGDGAARDALLTLSLSGPAALLPREGCALSDDARSIACHLGDVAPGGTTTLVLDAAADAPLAAGLHLAEAGASLTHAGGSVDAAPALVQVLAGAQLVLTDTVTPTTLRPGETARFDIRYVNVGNGTALDAVVAWTPPSDVLVVAVSAGGSVGDDGAVRWSVGDVLAGGGGSVWADVQIAPGAPDGRTTVHDHAELTSTNAPPAEGSAQLVLVIEPRLRVSIVATPAAVGPGDAFAYTLRYANDGDADARDATLQLALEGPASLEGASDGGSASGASATWALGTLTPGAEGSVEATARAATDLEEGTHLVAATPRLLATNAAEATAAPALVAVHVGALLALRAEVEPPQARPGDEVTWHLAWRHLGNGTTPPATLSDAPWPGVTVTSVTDGGLVAPDGTIRWALGPLAPGASGSVSWSGRLPSVLPAGATLVPDDALLSASPMLPARASASVLVHAAPRLALDLAADRAATGPGGAILYTLRVENVGDAHAENAQVELTLAGPATAAVSSWSLPSLLVGEPALLEAPADVAALLTHGDHLVHASAVASAPDAAEVAHGGPVDVLVVARAQLALAVAVEPTPARPGDATVWTLAYANAGNATALDVRLQDVAPPELGGAALGELGASTTLAWDLGALRPGEAGLATWSATVRFPMPAGRTLLSDGARLEAPGVPPALARATLAVDAAPSLAVEKVVDRGRAGAGDLLTYTLRVRNVGDADASGVTLWDPLPPLVGFVSASHDGGYDASSGAVRWVLGPLAAGASVERTFVARVAPVLPDEDTPVVNVAYAASAEGATAVSAPVVTLVRGIPSLVVTKLANVTSAQEGEYLRYVITVVNLGSAHARDVVVTDELPAAHRFLRAQPASATWDGRSVRLALPQLAAAGGIATLTIDVRVGPVSERVLPTCNVAVVSGTNVQTVTAEDCVDLTCILAVRLPTTAAAHASPLPTLPRFDARVEQMGPGTSTHREPSIAVSHGGASLQLSEATTRASVLDDASEGRAALVVGRFELLGGRIHGDGFEAHARVRTTETEADWDIEGSRFVNLTIDGVRYGDVAPNTTIPIGGGRVELKVARVGSGVPTHGAGGVAARRVEVELTMLRVVFVSPELAAMETPPPELRVGVARATGVRSVEPECGPTPPAPHVHAEAIGVRSQLGLHVDRALVTGPASGTSEHRVAAHAEDGASAEGLHARAVGTVTPTAAEALAEVQVGRIVLAGGLVNADGLYARASARSGEAPVVEELRFVDLVVAGRRIAQDVPPNTKIVTANSAVVVNEQVIEADGSLRVTLLRVNLPGGAATSVGLLRVGTSVR